MFYLIKEFTVIKVFLSESTDPWFNLATEDWIFHDMDPSFQVLFLWRNEDTVVIGRFQNPWTECDVDRMEKDSIKLARRQSGGGAVFHDLGNTNFTFLSGAGEYDKKRNNRIITDALARFGISAESTGRNDILVEGRKVSGSAFKLKKDRAFHHGTLLINADMSKLSKYLTPSKKKLMAKGIASARSRVANLAEFDAGLNHQRLCSAIQEEFFEVYGERCEAEILDLDTLKTIPHLTEYYERLKDWEWRFGKTPAFTHHLSEKLSWGCIEIYLNVKGGIIEDYQIYSDSLRPEMIQHLNNTLKGVKYQAGEVSKALNTAAGENAEWEDDIRELGLWLFENI